MSKRVSLSNELHTVMKGTVAIRILARHWIDSSGTGAEVECSEALTSVVILLVERLRLLDRAVRGVVDPREVWCAENQGDPPNDRSEKDMLLPVWSDAALVRHHRAELKRAKVRRRRESAVPR
jgi:hypothetical protein